MGLRRRRGTTGLRGGRRNVQRLPATRTPAYQQSNSRTPARTKPKNPLSISARQDEGCDLGSARGDALASRSKPTSTPTYRSPTSAPSKNLPTLLRQESSYRYASYQRSYRLPALLQRPTATDQHSEGSGSADEGLDLGSGKATKSHKHTYGTLAALLRRLETLPSYQHSNTFLPAF